MTAFFVLSTIVLASSAPPQECGCNDYPFEPNPPCFSYCVHLWASKKDPDLSKIKNLDAGVALGIKVLSRREPWARIDFDEIQSKRDLEFSAFQYLEHESAIAREENPKEEGDSINQ